MAITYPLDLPTSIGMEAISLRSVTAVGMTESPFTFRQQVVRHQGERWEASIKIPPVKSDLADPWVNFLIKLRGQWGIFLMGDPLKDPWVNFLIKLRGQWGIFLMGDPLKVTPSGTASTTPGTPVVNGAGQTGDELSIDGLPVSETGYLLAGDYIQLGTGSSANLYRVLSDVNTNVSGEATLDIFPKVVTATTDNDVVTVSNPSGRFRLAKNVSEWEINSVTTSGIQFEAMGVVP
jgi:hypothetical protein